jgi:cobalt-zinc-cadmium efflux system outer membrane protein
MNHVRILGLVLGVGVASSALAEVNWNDPQSLAATAVANHPAIARVEAEVSAARERIAPAGALPNPMLMGGVQDKMVNLEDDEMMTMYMVGATQSFSRESKREARREVARLAADVTGKELGSLRAEISRDVLLAWYDLAAVDSGLRALDEVRELAEAIISASRVRYEVGTAVQADVVRAQLQLSNLDQQRLSLQGRRRVVLARLLPLVGLPLTTEVPLLSFPEESERRSISTPPVPPDAHPAIVALEAEVQRQDAQIRLARLGTKPDFGLEASYGFRREQTDMFTLLATVELPIQRKKVIEPQIREAMALRESARQRISELRLALTQALGNALSVHEEATTQLRFLDEVLVPQTRLAVESTLTAYQTGRAPFEATLATQQSFLNLRLQYYELLRRHVQAIVDYEAILAGARSSALGAGSSVTSFSASPASSSESSGMGGMQ